MIVEEGLPRASTQKINQRAGVSNGAQQHHYPTRAELIVSSLEELTNEFIDQLEVHIGGIEGDDTLGTVLRLIASTADEHERYRLCWIEAMVAARTSPEIADAMRSLDHAKTERFRQVAARIAGCDPDLAANIAELTIYLVRGVGLQRSLHPDADYGQLIDLWFDMVDSVIAGSSGM